MPSPRERHFWIREGYSAKFQTSFWVAVPAEGRNPVWDFSTDPEFQARLDWAAWFVREEIEPIDVLFPGTADPYDRESEVYREVVRPLQAQVREQGLWAAHLPPSL